MNFCNVFRENSKRTRIQFFRNELIQHMWTHYIEIENDFLMQYLKEISQTEHGTTKGLILLKDMESLSARLGFKILQNLEFPGAQHNQMAMMGPEVRAAGFQQCFFGPGALASKS